MPYLNIERKRDLYTKQIVILVQNLTNSKYEHPNIIIMQNVLVYRLKAVVGSNSALREEVKELRAHLDDLKSPIVFCHNDLFFKNIIHDPEKGILVHLFSIGLQKVTFSKDFDWCM